MIYKKNLYTSIIMNEIFAIPIESGVLCSHFGHCSLFAIIQIEKNNIVETKYLVPPHHEPGVLPNWLAEQCNRSYCSRNRSKCY